MKFVDRIDEAARLKDALAREKSSLVVMYGRRRLGKSTLIKRVLSDTDVYFLADRSEGQHQRVLLAKVIAQVFPDFDKLTYPDWESMFRAVNYRTDKRFTLCLDEFPYLVKTNSAFPSILQNVWDEILKDSNVMLILSGSFISMMQKHALSYDSPLYGRRTAQMRLAPLPFTDIYAVQKMPFDQAVEQYAITGGIPKYLEFFEDGRPLEEQLKDTVLSKSGFLYEEPNFLLKSESVTAVNYFSIIKTIADGNHKLGKIAGILGQETSSLTPYLSTLLDLGFIEKRTPITEKNPEKSRKGLYFIADNFIRFWFRYVYPYKGELELDNMQIVLDEMHKDFREKFVAFIYEDICKTIFVELCRNEEITFTPSRSGSYWLNDFDGDTEIDVLFVDHQNKRVFAGECKYHAKPVDAQVYFALKEKVNNATEIRKAFPGYEVIYGVFSKSGFTQRMLDIAKESADILLVNEDHLV